MTISLGEEVDKITEGIIGAGMEVSRTLGHGFLEAVYRKALVHELALSGFLVEEELAFQVCYKDVKVGAYQCDILVNHRVIVELKAVEQLTSSHVGQVVNYLRASGLKVGLLFNFGRPKLQFRRVLF
ncbi:MAG: GxxExxY protein [Desulforhabdus sp.]|jgi:GxxExxY protein|nr:GxxExxY protein [Desulforhabdus sp.]